MTRDQRKDVVEVVGLLAIVGSVVFLGLEIRQNTVQLRLANQQSTLALAHDWDALAMDADFSNVYVTGIQDLSALALSDFQRFDRFIGQGLNIWEFAFESYQSGTMSDETWSAWNRWFAGEISQTSWQEIWESKRSGYGEAFVAHVDAIIAMK